MKKQTKASKIKTAIISIIAAIFIWAAISHINPPTIRTTISNLPVRFTGEEQLKNIGLTVVDKSAIPMLSVSVKGKKNDLLSLSGGIYVEVDVSSISNKGEYNLTGNVTLPSSAITINSVKFDSVPVKVEEIISKEIPLRAAQTGSINGKLVRTVPEQETVIITGAKSEVDAVSYGEAAVDISKASDGYKIDAPYMLMNENDAPISRNETISSSKTHINVICTLYDAVTLPVRARLSDALADTYTLDEDATVIMPSSIEAGLKDVSAKNVEVVINSAENDLKGTLTEIEGMYIPEASKQVRIKAAIKKKVTKTISVNVKPGNLKTNLKAYIEPVNITVSGAEEDIAAANINASVDLSGYGSGVFTLPVIIDSRKLTPVGEYEATVTIS